jgi:iron(III) transport system ATP-binding protein
VADFVGTMNFLAGKVLGNGNVGMAGIELEVAEPINTIAAGGDVVVCIRPEDVLVRDVRLGAPNAFEVTIQDMEFLGSFFRVLLQPRQPRAAAFRADFSINLAREVGAEPGKTLPVAFAASRTLVFAGTLNGAT